LRLKRADGNGHKDHQVHKDHTNPMGLFVIFVILVFFVAAAVGSSRWQTPVAVPVAVGSSQ
jgi:hypothetical protein